MATNHTTTFWHFIENHLIEIPIIQRDYAQGRIDKDSLRKNFLNDLKEALDNSREMKLDFVYGSTENGKLYPLDGQQRLTTLWLLHWYIALKADKLKEASDHLKKFSYETRISSRNFCEELCNPENFKNYNCSNDIVEFITNQTWFYSAWKQDPTIQSVLRMLGGSKEQKDIEDGIEKVFGCCNCISNRENRFEHYYALLTGKDCPIVFYYLPKDFGISDDLYIKMNARGEQLTSFENFKADLIGYIKKQTEKEAMDKKQQEEWKKLLDPNDGIPIKLDTDWTNIFWKHKSKEYKIDDIYFAFLNRFFLNELICLKDETKIEGDKTEIKYKFTADNLEKKNKTFECLYGDKGNDSELKYNDLSVYQYSSGKIPFHFFDSLQKTLNKYPNSKKKINNYFPVWVDSKFEFISQYINEEITVLGQKERIIFLSVCRYYENNSSAFDDNNFKQWMRVVWNIVENAGIDTISAMIGAIRLIDELSEHSHDIYSYLKDNPKIKSGTAEAQVAEEIAKAKQIIDENGTHRKYNGSCKKENGLNYETWEEIIIEAESYAFFKGAIRFLFQDAEGKVTEDSWKNFDTKWENAQKYFDNKASTISLAEYCTDEQTKNIWSKFSFEYKNWKSLLLQDDICEPIHKFLLKSDKPNPTVLLNDLRLLLPELKKEKDGDQDSYVWLLKDWASCNVVLTNYSVRKREPYNGWVLEVGNNIRNNWNSIIANNDSIIKTIPDAWGNESYNIDGKIYYRGLWTNFKYEKYYFAYYGNNTICLMNDNWNGKKLKDESKPNYPDNNFYFQVDREETSKSFFDKLNNFINEYTNHTNTNPNN